MDPNILAIALLRRLGGDVILSDVEIATAAQCSVTFKDTQEQAVSCIAIDARGVPFPQRRMEECKPILAR